VTAPVTAQRGMTKKQRTTVTRSIQYAAIVLIVVVLALVGHWKDFQTQFLDWHVMGQILPRMIKTGLVNTLLFTVSSFIFGLILGLIVALMRMSEVRLYRWIATVYVELLRGLPTLLVLYLLAYAIPTLFGNNNKFFSNFYVLVVLGLGSVAARTLGMPTGRAMLSIVLPQAFRIIIPPLTNEVILLVKDSSLVYAIGLASNQYELTYLGQTAASGGITGIDANSSPLVLAGIAYLVITLPLSQAVRALERKQAKRR